jgi:hypothetical protein
MKKYFILTYSDNTQDYVKIFTTEALALAYEEKAKASGWFHEDSFNIKEDVADEVWDY